MTRPREQAASLAGAARGARRRGPAGPDHPHRAAAAGRRRRGRPARARRRTSSWCSRAPTPCACSPATWRGARRTAACRAGPVVAAVGPATAAALERHGLACHLVPDEYVAEGLRGLAERARMPRRRRPRAHPVRQRRPRRAPRDAARAGSGGRRAAHLRHRRRRRARRAGGAGGGGRLHHVHVRQHRRGGWRACWTRRLRRRRRRPAALRAARRRPALLHRPRHQPRRCASSGSRWPSRPGSTRPRASSRPSPPTRAARRRLPEALRRRAHGVPAMRCAFSRVTWAPS